MVSSAAAPTSNSAAIQTATWRDLNAIRKLEQICFPKDAWPIWDVIGVLTLPSVVRLKAVVGEETVGFIAGDIRTAQNTAWIATIAVLPEYRRHGIGTALLRACEAKLTVAKVRLYVRVSNQPAIRLYKSLNYQRAGELDNYYQDGEAALVLEKQLHV